MTPITGLACGVITGVATDGPVAALTLDDGPHNVSTPRLLDLLERHDAIATFYLWGRRRRGIRRSSRRSRAAGPI